MLLLAIVSLQFILLQYNCAPFVLTKKLYIYISAVVNGRRVLQKTQLRNCGHAKIMSYEPHMQGLAKNSTQKLWSCINNVIRTTHANTI